MAGITLVLGGIVTFFAYRWIQTKDPTKVSKVLISIMCVLALTSVIGVICNVIMGFTLHQGPGHHHHGHDHGHDHSSHDFGMDELSGKKLIN